MCNYTDDQLFNTDWMNNIKYYFDLDELIEILERNRKCTRAYVDAVGATVDAVKLARELAENSVKITKFEVNQLKDETI